MELWDIYDADRQKTGRLHQRGLPLAPGEYHLIIDVCTVARGRLLLTRRHPDKHWGGMWECTGGAVQAGEDTLTAARRELREETGIPARPEELTRLGTVRGHNYFCVSYLVRRDSAVGELRLQAEEVVESRWVTLREFDEMCAGGRVVPSAEERFRRYQPVIAAFMSRE